MAAIDVIKYMTERGLTLAAAESLTGGMIASSIVSVPGASAVFMEGFVTYDSGAKVRTLGVPEDVIERLGAVSDETARLMALGAKDRAGTDCAVSSTGIAGPDAVEGKPVGLTYIAAVYGDRIVSRELHLRGSREEIREAATAEAIELLLCILKDSGP